MQGMCICMRKALRAQPPACAPQTASLSPFSVALLRLAVSRPPRLSLPTKLYPHNASAEEENLTQLHQLPGQIRKWVARDDGTMK